MSLDCRSPTGDIGDARGSDLPRRPASLSGDAGQHCTAARALAGAKHGVIVTTPTGMAVDSNDCLSVSLDTR